MNDETISYYVKACKIYEELHEAGVLDDERYARIMGCIEKHHDLMEAACACTELYDTYPDSPKTVQSDEELEDDRKTVRGPYTR